jgi:antirestriction protein ArdC
MSGEGSEPPDRLCVERDEARGGRRERKQAPFLARYNVFNVEQVDDLPSRFYAPPPIPEKRCEPFFAAIPADIRHGGIDAYFDLKKDCIHLPHPEHFASIEHYEATRLHESVHWTGHRSRLAREFGRRYGDEAYAFEELVAELGSAFLSAELGLRTELHRGVHLEPGQDLRAPAGDLHGRRPATDAANT